MNTEYFVGLDLGEKRDPTALALLERRGTTAEPQTLSFQVKHLQRFRLGTSYPEIVRTVTAMLMRSEFMRDEEIQRGAHIEVRRSWVQTTLVIDNTGLGQPVTELFRQAEPRAEIVSVTITGGDKVTNDADSYRVPKRTLVAGAQVALQTRRLQIGAALPFADTLVRELENFKVKINDNANDIYGARSGEHDDLVLAVCLAVWAGNTFDNSPYELDSPLGRVMLDPLGRAVMDW
jgi:hypothetical protein